MPIEAITTPGIYAMTHDVYHADPCVEPSLSSSLAKLLISRSPQHAAMAHPRLNPNFASSESDRFDLGSAAHDYLLTGGDGIIVCGFDDWRSKAAQAERDGARADGKTPVLAKQFERIQAMSEVAKRALSDSPDLGIELSEGKAEESFFWCEDGAWCRSRPDWHCEKLELILDYKTTAGSANPSAMARLAASMGWDVQAALYLRGYKRLIGSRKGPRFVFMVQEIEPPYCVSFCGISGTFLALGEDKVEHAIKAWRSCVKSQCWSGYPQKIVYPDPPAYALMEWEESDLCRPL